MRQSIHFCKLFACVQQPMGLLVCMARSVVAFFSEVIASLFMVACRQRCLISALNGAASDSGRKCLCSVSLIVHLLKNGERERKTESNRETERGETSGLGRAVA